VINISQFSNEEFNTLFAFSVGNKIKAVFSVADNHLVVITSIQIINNDTSDHDFQLQFQGNGFAGQLAPMVTKKITPGTSRMLLPGDQPVIDADWLQHALILAGPCEMVIQDLMALATASRTIGIKINWMEGISTADISGAVEPQVSTSP